MGLDYFVIILTKFFSFVSWPPFAMVYPLYASIRAVESNQHYQQCLAYWVLFSITTILELPLTKLLLWFPFWPYAKGLAALLLVTPYFSGASYIYMHYIRPCIFDTTQVNSIMITSETKSSMLYENNGFVDSAEEQIEGETERVKLVVHEDNSSSRYYTEEISQAWTGNLMKVQKEWSCAICLVNTARRKDLESHMRGRKHKFRVDELRKVELVTDKTAKINVTTGIKSKVLFQNFNQKLTGLLNPVVRSVRWCIWRKPELGCLKLNTDGYIDKDGSGFGGLFRNYKGDPICAYASKASHDDIFMVELWAIWRGLVLALSLKIDTIWIESDSLSVVNTINRKQPHGPKPSDCLNHIWKMLEKIDRYQVTHTWREANRAADYVAKMNSTGTDVVISPSDFPDALRKIIEDDAQGTWYGRH
ncbi:hypothetical protein DCAR_0626440 [Daucus carota subsp. sativus]|uniref:RNase H type-1 domain-containing protein n=1 Tax=Daucus carota subsp. sativus TaxID=79200 RepID=A0AAF1B8B3_DAUCS|nr:hypothetical protein DCAR_0626440 [Daucus carota subsp. sativus]